MTTNAIVLPANQNDDGSLSLAPLEKMTRLEQFQAYFRDNGIDVNDNDADGIKSLTVFDKDTLLKRPLLLVRWNFNEGTYGEFVSAEFALEDGTLGVLNEGGTGIYQQLKELTAHRTANGHPAPQAGRMVKGGLTSTNYFYKDSEKGSGRKPTAIPDGTTSSQIPEGENAKDWKGASTYYLQF